MLNVVVLNNIKTCDIAVVLDGKNRNIMLCKINSCKCAAQLSTYIKIFQIILLITKRRTFLLSDKFEPTRTVICCLLFFAICTTVPWKKQKGRTF